MIFGKKKTRELEAPPGASRDTQSVEVLRAWIVNGGLEVALAPMALGRDGATWGILLVDVARHVARAIHAETGQAEEATLEAIRHMFDAEWRNATDLGSTQKSPEVH